MLMALFEQNKIPVDDVLQLREQGLTDALIAEELKNRGYNQKQVAQALSQADLAAGSGAGMTAPEAESSAYGGYGNVSQPLAQASASQFSPQASFGDSNLYERMEEIVENMIDEKWDELLAEVKKIVEWKESIEEKQVQIINDLEKLKEDFTVLHQGVLGKLEDYDTQMRDVGTELKAVGRVFKDVVPEFVENVKELKSMTGKMKK
jgi:hypothetical protein